MFHFIIGINLPLSTSVHDCNLEKAELVPLFCLPLSTSTQDCNFNIPFSSCIFVSSTMFKRTRLQHGNTAGFAEAESNFH